MDLCNIPSCALNRQVTTVIIRNKMDFSENFCQFELCPNSASPMVVHRPSGCEKCKRTRLNNQYSDCDSGLVGKCRTYKSRAAKSRYVNVCAVVCLLLLVGGLSPRSSAAPYRSRTMDREKRAADGENSLWGNPCNYTWFNSNKVYTPALADKVRRQAKFTYEKAVSYKDEFASKLFSFSSFDALWTSSWTDDHFLSQEVLPKEKVLYQKMSDDAMNQLMGKIDEVLPSMYKEMKMVVAGMHMFTESLNNTNISTDAILTANLTNIDVRSVLCVFYDLMVIRHLEIKPLLDKDIPTITKANQLSKGFLIYRDTLNYLEYLEQFFQKMAETDLSKAA